MSFLKLLLGLAFMGVILFFAVLNLEETVDVRIWTDPGHTYRDVPLVVALFLAYLIGMLTYLLIRLPKDIRTQSQMGRLRRTNQGLLDELHHLRGSVLDDLPTSERPEPGSGEGRSR